MYTNLKQCKHSHIIDNLQDLIHAKQIHEMIAWKQSAFDNSSTQIIRSLDQITNSNSN